MSELVTTLRPMTGATKPAQRAPKSVKVRFQSSAMLAAPGFVAWLQAMARFRSDRPKALKILRATYPGLPAWAYGKIVDGQTDAQTVAEDGSVTLVITR